MLVSSEAIVFRQTKASGGRKMILLFTKKYGKISAGTSIAEKGKNRTSLAISPFAYGEYDLFKNRDLYNLSRGEVKNSFYSIGEDLDKYMNASFVLELTDKLLPEEVPEPALFNLLLDFLKSMETREKSHGTLVLAYEIKALQLLGSMPEIDQCPLCGKKGENKYFSVPSGGMICDSCKEKLTEETPKGDWQKLIFKPEFDIIGVLKYFLKTPLYRFEKIELNREVQKELQLILREYMSYHMDVGKLKSESIFNNNF